MKDGQKTDVGSRGYFSKLINGTVFERMKTPNKGTEFSQHLQEISQKAAKAMNQLYADLDSNTDTLKLLSSNERAGVLELTKNLVGVMSFASSNPFAKTENDITKKLNGSTLKPNTKKNNKTNRGKNGKVVGSKEYRELTAIFVFGSRFVQSASFQQGFKNYKTGIQAQVDNIINILKKDIKAAISKGEYMEYDMREVMKVVFSDFLKHAKRTTEDFRKILQQLQRLEDFQNKVIKINCTGAAYPVQAKLCWENGENTLYLSAKINFMYFHPIDAFKEFINKNVSDTRKKNALTAFNRWDNNGNKYANIFGNQSVKVVINLTETQNSFNCVRVFLDMPGDYSMGWGGIGLIDWKAYTSKIIFLSDAHTSDGTATHEFGHILGLGDAYVSKYIPGLYWGNGVDYSKYPDAEATIMESLSEKSKHTAPDTPALPTSNDIEMVINAFFTGKRQNFQSECFWHDVSPVLGK